MENRYDELFRRHIADEEKRDNINGVNFLRAQRVAMRAALASGLIHELPQEIEATATPVKLTPIDSFEERQAWRSSFEGLAYENELQRMRLSPSAFRLLLRNAPLWPGITNINQLLNATEAEILSIRNVGPKLVREILEARANYLPDSED